MAIAKEINVFENLHYIFGMDDRWLQARDSVVSLMKVDIMY